MIHRARQAHAITSEATDTHPLWGPRGSLIKRGSAAADLSDFRLSLPDFVSGVITADRIATGDVNVSDGHKTPETWREELGQTAAALGQDPCIRHVERPNGEFIIPSPAEQCLLLSNRIAYHHETLTGNGRLFSAIDMIHTDGSAWYRDGDRVLAQFELMQEFGPLRRARTIQEIMDKKSDATPMISRPEFHLIALGEASSLMHKRGSVTSDDHLSPEQGRQLRLVRHRTADAIAHLNQLKEEAYQADVVGFTPGPWRAAVANDDSFGAYPASTIHGDMMSSHLRGYSRNIEDVRLILSAPDLYAGCVVALRALTTNDTEERERATRRLAAALRRAHGNDPDSRLTS